MVNSIKKELGLSLIFNILTLLISLGLISYLSKSLSLDDFGKYQLILAFIGIVSIFSLSGINIIINKSVLNNKENVIRNIFYKTYKSVIWVFFFFLMLLLFTNLFLENEKVDFLLIALLFLPLLGLERYEAILYAKQRFKLIRVLNLINIFCYTIFGIALIEFTQNYLYIFLSMFVIKAVIVFIGLRYSFNAIKSKYDENSENKNEMTEGYKLSFLSFYNNGIGYLDKLILGFLDYKLLAIYAIGVLIPLKVKDQLKILIGILVQRWAKFGEAYYIKRVKSFNKYIFLGSFILGLLVYFTAEYYIPILFDKEYLSAQNIILIISLSIPFILSSYVYETYIIVFHNTSFYQKVTYSKQLFYIIVLLSLIPFLDIIGVAIAFLLRSVYSFTLNYIYYFKVIK